MKKIFPLVLTVLIFACENKNSKGTSESQKTISRYAYYEQVFNQIDSLLKLDNSQFWGHELYGPILFVNPDTREVIANQNNSTGSFTKIGNVFKGTLPSEVNIANTATNWEGERWTMVMTPLPEDVNIRNNLIIHELFHRIQSSIGFDSLFEKNNNHLDTYTGRILLKLELEALKNALDEENSNSSNIHIENALAFRRARQSESDLQIAENSLEINEGLAEYTGVMLSGRSEVEMKAHFKESINLFYENKTFVRSFAYETIPIYGFMLSQVKPNWQKEIDKKTILTRYISDGLSIQSQEIKDYVAIATANDYSYSRILEEEKEREKQRLAQLSAYRKTFIENPTLSLQFRNMNISFDPRDITPLEDYGTVYLIMRVTDDWGILSVQKGALLSPTWSGVTVSEPTNFETQRVEGEGWTLELNEGWIVEKSANSYLLKKAIANKH
ncbi:hypothetical protein [Ekhidna sp.]|uniref:hypothetical protein n=1 Tax=Ekhidna sp. TaxID=2608089 RepID=UPI0035174AE4